MSAASRKGRTWISRWTRIPIGHFHGVGHAGAQFADDGQQRRHLRLRHRRDERGLQIEARHDGECFHHRRPTRKCADHSEWRAALPSAGRRRGADQCGCGANAPATNGGNVAGGAGGQGRRGGGRGRGEHPVVPHGLCACRATGNDAKLQAVQIRTGISDGISTEVLSGLDEGAQVVTGVVVTGAQTAGGVQSVWRRFPAPALIRSSQFSVQTNPVIKLDGHPQDVSHRRSGRPRRARHFAGNFPGRICGASWARAAPAKAR